MTNDRRTITISLGDPGGIGPEVTVGALHRFLKSDESTGTRFTIHGSSAAMHAASDALRIDPFWWRVDARSALAETVGAHDVVLLDSDPEMIAQGASAPLERGFDRAPTKLGGELSFRWVEAAIADAKREAGDPRRADAVVTAPISKAAWAKAGRSRWPGHTELFADRFKSNRFAMMFAGDKLRVVLATVHIPLHEVRGALTLGSVHTAIELGNEACKKLGIRKPRVAVCGLNPHAGEGGLLGDDEERLITPAIELSVRQGIHASGPHPADTVYNAAAQGKYDLVVAMYHDQGLIPVKLLERDLAVNTTLGLPIPRTSPDHGTAFDIAGTGKADPGSMLHAIRLAVRLTKAETADAAGVPQER